MYVGHLHVLVKMSVQTLHSKKNGLFVFSLWRFKISLHILNTSPLADIYIYIYIYIYMICKYFLPFCGLPFHFLDGIL